MLRMRLVTTLAFVAGLTAAGYSHANVVFKIERYSDTLGVMTGAGDFALAPVVNAQNFALDAPFGVEPLESSAAFYRAGNPEDQTIGAGYLMVGSQDIFFAGVLPRLTNLTGTGEAVLYLGSNDPLEGPVEGLLVLDLRWTGATTFAPVGTTGTVYNGAACQGCGTIIEIGTWEMVAGLGTPPEVVDPPGTIPEPTSITLFIFGLVGLGFAHRRKKA